MKYSALLLAFSFQTLALVLPRNPDKECTSQILSIGGCSGPLGQLPDGQNRCGGAYPPASYTFANGAITDAQGRGCIITPEASQFQCDEGAAPVTGFSIDSKDTIAYAGSSAFYACPATDTEYNIYTQPVKDQAKCTIVTLEAKDCDSPAPAPAPIPKPIPEPIPEPIPVPVPVPEPVAPAPAPKKCPWHHKKCWSPPKSWR